MWVHGYTHTHPSTLLAFLITAQLSPVLNPLFTFLKTATIPTYYGIFKTFRDILPCNFPLFYFFLYFFFFFFLSLALFFWKVRCLIPTCGGIIVFIILSSLGQCSNNEDHHTYMDLQLKDYTSKLEQGMTLYECLRRCTGICNESRATCMNIMKVALPQIRCQLHDHAKSNMTKVMRAIWTEQWKVAWQYISEWLWKCHNR